MPTLETPPNPAPTTPEPPTRESSSSRLRAGRFGELDHSELIHLLDSLDDERAKARFRESLYISTFFCVAIALFLIFAPRYLPHAPRFVVPVGLKKNKEMTQLSVPADVQRALNHAPRFKTPPAQQSSNKAPEPPPPLAPAPAQQPQPTPQAQAPKNTPQAAAPPPVVQQSPMQQPQPQQNTAALPSAPAPAPGAARPDFGSQPKSARDQVQQAARGTGDSGGDLPAVPSKRGDIASGMDILTDTQGVDFSAWNRHTVKDIYRNWYPLLPISFFPPLSKRGTVAIRIVINADGSIADMKLESPSGDVSLDKAAWGALTTEGQFPHLPANFHGPNIEIRFTFQYNPNEH